ncbi:alpha/beta fold hydrolase [Limimonas halophila]|uniref:alpha/beta fold hydrolase n=1 Tax=Limimonas halophila TaxID=1082479 RepID=UPI000AE21979|nr:alpha/beta fold hydrolase [Limimonas halophila]
MAETAARLRTDLADADPVAFNAALQRSLIARQHALLDGIEAYRSHPYRRDIAEPPAIWREGTTRLLDYGAVPGGPGSDAPAILAIPSLINRAYILDLKADTSLLRHLAASGLRPLLVDWDAPGEVERGFDLTAYIAGRLEAALDAAREAAGGRPLVVLGYCMGGLLALALAQRRPRDVAGLALLATPWDFHATNPGQARLAAQAATAMEPLMQTMGELPTDAVQTFFAGLDPMTAARKFTAFARMPGGKRAERFVAVEDWLNDGVPLAAPAARACLHGWYGANTPARGQWRVAGRPVDPAAVRCPAFALVPRADRIVPPESALALTQQLADVRVETPELGHIGMVTSSRAADAAWKPLRDWLHATLGTAAPIVQRT